MKIGLCQFSWQSVMQFSNKFGANLSLPRWPFFLERLQPITAAAMCTVAINVPKHGAFNPKSQYFIPLFHTISWLCGQQPGGDETSNEGVQLRPNRPSLYGSLYCLGTHVLESAELGKLAILQIQEATSEYRTTFKSPNFEIKKNLQTSVLSSSR
jgi:hypothetical protein